MGLQQTCSSYGSYLQEPEGMISIARSNLRRQHEKPFKWTFVHTSDHPMSMWSSAHPHPISVLAKAPDRTKPYYATSTKVKIEHQNTRGGVERANIALNVLRTIARRARTGTPWDQCGLGEPMSTMAEFRLNLTLKDFGCGPCVEITDGLVTNFDLSFCAYIIGHNIAHICAAIESIADFKFTR